MIGGIIGVALGVCELLLLKYLIDGVTSGAIRWWLVPMKLVAIAAFLVPCALIVPQELHYAGIAAAAVLIFGSALVFLKRTHIRNGSDTK